MSTRSTITRGRRFVESRMTSTCRVVTITKTVDGTDDAETESEKTYEGICDVVFPSETASDRESAGQAAVSQRPLLKLPVDASAAVQVNQVAIITANADDPGKVGMRLRIAGEHFQTNATSRRLVVEVES